MTITMLPEVERVVRAIERDPESGCWTWTRSTNGVGYGMFFLRGQRHYAHRFTYAQVAGPIPPGFVIDHLCRNTLCCNPEHLEAVTHLENVRRSPLIGAKTHCKAGHAFDDENTYITPAGARACRACRRARQVARRRTIRGNR